MLVRGNFSYLRKRLGSRTITALSIRFSFLLIDTSARQMWSGIELRARSSGRINLEKHESSPRLAARDGMEQEPYEFRIRSAKPESQGEAT